MKTKRRFLLFLIFCFFSTAGFAHALQLTKSFTDDLVEPGGVVTLEFTITNEDQSNAATGITFTDDLDAVLSGLVAFGLPLDNPCGLGSMLSGTSVLTLTGGNLPAGGSCTFDVQLQVPEAAFNGVYPNTTSSITGNVGGTPVSGDPARDDLHVTTLAFSKAFLAPATPGGTATLRFTLQNFGSGFISALGFTDDLDAVLPGLVAVGLPVNDPCGIGSTLSGTSVLTLTGGHLPVGGSCTFDVQLQVPAGAVPGTYLNTTSDLLQSGSVVGYPATDTLNIEPLPLFSKSFAPDRIDTGEISTLSFMIDNSASSLTAEQLAFTDILPDGMAVADPAAASTNCIGGILTATPGTGVITYAGGSVAAGCVCAVQVNITASSPGMYVNTTTDLNSSLGNSGPASDSLEANQRPALPVPTMSLWGMLVLSLLVMALGFTAIRHRNRRGRS